MTLSIPTDLAWTPMGAGPPVVLLHSGGLTSRQWRSTTQALSPSYQVIAPDFLGYGRTGPWPESEPFHFHRDIEAAERLLSQLEPVHLVGHSYGGLIAAHLALRHPGKIRTLTLCEPVTFGVLHSTHDRAGLDDLPPWDPSMRLDTLERRSAWVEHFVDYWSGPGAWSRLGESTRQAFLDVVVKLHGEVTSLLDDKTPAEAYDALSMPTLLIHGESTTLAAKRVVQILASHIPASSIHAIPGAGHMSPITHAAQVGRLILDHLTAVDPPAQG